MHFEILVTELSEIVKIFKMDVLYVFLDKGFESSNSIFALIPSSGDIFKNDILTVLV
jgi:hypothetical protein